MEGGTRLMELGGQDLWNFMLDSHFWASDT